MNHQFCSLVQKCICPLFELKEFLYCKCILATLLQSKAQYLKIFVLSIKQGNRFCSVCFSISVIYYGPANWSCRRQIPCVNYFIIIIFYEVFLCFFLSQFFQKNVFSFCVLVLENQEAFSESCSFISGVLQGLGKICKNYMEVNHFLLLICNLEK